MPWPKTSAKDDPGDDPGDTPSDDPAPANPDDIWKRLWGDTAFESTQAISQEGWQTSETVVIATFTGFWDALSASSLAGANNAPILLTMPDALSPTCADEIMRLQASHAIIVGGTEAISDVCADQVRAVLTGQQLVERVGGEDAQDTTIKIAESVSERSDTCIVATSGGFWDALTGGPLCGKGNGVLVLASETGLSATALPKAHSAGITRAYVFGGTAALSEQVFAAFGATTGGGSQDSAVQATPKLISLAG